MRTILTVVMTIMVIAVGSITLSGIAAAEEPVWTKGEVTKIKPDTGKVTIRHEEIKNLDMPAMKMVFTVPDPEILGKLQEGQKREFHFARESGKLVIKQVKD